MRATKLATFVAVTTAACSVPDKFYRANATDDAGEIDSNGAQSDGSGSATSDASPADTPSVPNVKRVFITSQTYFPTWGSVLNADQYCGQLATAASLGGTWKAWVSLAAPADVNSRFNHATVPYTLVDRTTVVANDWTDLIDGTIAHAIDHTETGATLAQQTGCIDSSCYYVWTDTTTFAQYESSSFDCKGWTDMGNNPGITGNSKVTTGEWTRNNTIYSFGCSLKARLYCFEQ